MSLLDMCPALEMVRGDLKGEGIADIRPTDVTRKEKQHYKVFPHLPTCLFAKLTPMTAVLRVH